jgi:hypothetical protein
MLIRVNNRFICNQHPEGEFSIKRGLEAAVQRGRSPLIQINLAQAIRDSVVLCVRERNTLSA